MSKFKDMNVRYKVGFGVATTAAILGMAGGAFAYFSTSSNGSGSASVGTQVAWGAGNPTAGTHTGNLYPVVTHTGGFTGCLDNAGHTAAIPAGSDVSGTCTPYQDYTVTVTNNAPQSEALSTGITLKVDPTWNPTKLVAADEACTPSMFTIDGNAGGSYTDTSDNGVALAHAATETVTFTVILADDGSNQDNCQGQLPPLISSAS